MNKYLPFVFPAVAMLIIVFLAYRWFSLQTNRPLADIGEGIEIEDLTPDEAETVMRGTGEDVKEVELAGEEDQPMAQGDVRYEIKDGRVRFSVIANLPQPQGGFYQAWVKAGEAVSKAFRLEMNKGGYAGTAALNQNSLPFEVIVTQEQQDDETMETVILRGIVSE